MNELTGEEKAMALAKSMKAGRKAGLTYAEWLEKNPQGPDQPYHPLQESLESVYNDL